MQCSGDSFVKNFLVEDILSTYVLCYAVAYVRVNLL